MARPTPAATGIRRHPPGEPERPEGCHRLGFSSLCHGRWHAHFSWARKSTLIAQCRLVWVWQHPLLPQPSPHSQRNSRFARSEGTRYNPSIPIAMVPKTTAPGLILSLTTAYSISLIIAKLNFKQFRSFKHRAREVHNSILNETWTLVSSPLLEEGTRTQPV